VSLAVNPDHLLSEHGLGFCSGSFENLIRDVNRLIEDHNLRKRMGEKACRFAVENFDIDKIGKKFHEFICKLIK
jgi:glycosyltransferase involved in cell wall biosynthesis